MAWEQKLINDYGVKCDLDSQDKERKQEMLKLASITDRMDGICRAVITRFKNIRGLQNSAELMFNDFQSPEWYRMKRAERLLKLRQKKRNLPLVWGVELGSDVIRKELRNANYCGQVYKGKVKPDILVMG